MCLVGGCVGFLTFISQTSVSSLYGGKVSWDKIVDASDAIVSRVMVSFMVLSTWSELLQSCGRLEARWDCCS